MIFQLRSEFCTIITYFYIDQESLSLDVTDEVAKADEKKLANLIKRRKIYGDITQNATEEELESLLKKYGNQVPKVSSSLNIPSV